MNVQNQLSNIQNNVQLKTPNVNSVRGSSRLREVNQPIDLVSCPCIYESYGFSLTPYLQKTPKPNLALKYLIIPTNAAINL